MIRSRCKLPFKFPNAKWIARHEATWNFFMFAFIDKQSDTFLMQQLGQRRESKSVVSSHKSSSCSIQKKLTKEWLLSWGINKNFKETFEAR